MSGTGSDRIRMRTTAIALVNLLAFGLLGCDDDADGGGPPRGRGLLVSPHSEITMCDPAIYEGPGTELYSNRPYHTRDTATVARGLAFCRGARHGTNVWSIEVFRPTRLVVFGYRGDGLEERGWTPSEDPLEVDAAGVSLDRIYSRSFAVGRYVIRQGFTPTAPIVLWDSSAVRTIP